MSAVHQTPQGHQSVDPLAWQAGLGPLFHQVSNLQQLKGKQKVGETAAQLKRNFSAAGMVHVHDWLWCLFAAQC
jgi:hypothetical protein